MAGVPAPGGLFGRARAETCLVSPETQVVGPVMINGVVLVYSAKWGSVGYDITTAVQKLF